MADVKQTAGRLVFAVADQDRAQLLEALREFPPSENLALVLTLADTAAAALEALHGDSWRDALNMALLAVSVEGVDGGAAETG